MLAFVDKILAPLCWIAAAALFAMLLFGPTWPDAPAAARVWQPPQPAEANTALPEGALGAAFAAVVVSLRAPINSGPASSAITTTAAATHITTASARSTRAIKGDRSRR